MSILVGTSSSSVVSGLTRSTSTPTILPSSVVISGLTRSTPPIITNNQFLHFNSTDKLCCTRKSSQDFSILETDLEADIGSTWSTMAFYLFSFHIPLSFGGLSVVAHLLHQPLLHPNTQAFSLLLIQTLELLSFLSLLKFTDTRFNIVSFFQTRVLPKERNWLLASVLGVTFLLALFFFTSFVADKLVGPKDVNNPVLKEILSGGPVSVAGSTLVYCLVTPVLEETVYRGFLLTCLASTMKWENAVVISSIVFSATHLSVDSFLQLFVIGAVLGCSYCWTGTLLSPFLIHSLYNALILVVTFTS